MTTAKPPARYSAMESARAGDFATPELHHPLGHDLPERAGAYRRELLRGREVRSVELPGRLGECVITKIAAIVDRFGERLTKREPRDFDPGVRLYFSNGGTQVSYSREPSLMRSQIGDNVRMCLTHVEQDCPPGDDRDKVYTTTNSRTGESWTLSPTQHMCGGA
jgi:hypothetical protein